MHVRYFIHAVTVFKPRGLNSEIHLSFFFFFLRQEQCANFEYMLWFESLLFYGFEEHSTLHRGDGDIGLLPSIVEKVILSKLAGRTSHTAAAGC